MAANPKYWIRGIFYYNKSDKRLLPPKRDENYGYTINFASPKSIAFFAGMLCFFGFVILMIVLNAK